jgi:hypothetical protein
VICKLQVAFQNDHVHTSDPPDLAWFLDHESDSTVYIPHALWVAMGRPQALNVELAPA